MFLFHDQSCSLTLPRENRQQRSCLEYDESVYASFLQAHVLVFGPFPNLYAPFLAFDSGPCVGQKALPMSQSLWPTLLGLLGARVSPQRSCLVIGHDVWAADLGNKWSVYIFGPVTKSTI